MMLIESRSNQWVKYIKKLSRRHFRDREGLFAVEGVRAVEEVLKSNSRIEIIAYSLPVRSAFRGQKLIDDAQRQGIHTVRVTEKIMAELSDTETPQGVLAVVHQAHVKLSDILSNAPSNVTPLLVLVDGIQDPGNLGNIIRTSASAGAQGVILLPGTVDLYNPKTLRSAMGNIFKVPVVVAGERVRVIQKLKNAGLKLVVGDLNTNTVVFEIDLTGPVVIVVGNEGGGVQDDLLKMAGSRVKIPMSAGVDSLNVAVAASIMIYEVVRQRYN